MTQPILKKLAGAALAASIALGFAQAANAQSGDGPRYSRDGQHDRGMHRHHRGDRGPMAGLRSLNLSEAQKDQIFKLFHDAAPAMREQRKAVRHSREELRRISGAPSFDQNAARTAADAGARASAALSVMRAELRAKVRAVLTPEQRAQADKMQERRGHRGERGERRYHRQGT